VELKNSPNADILHASMEVLANGHLLNIGKAKNKFKSYIYKILQMELK
jgi:hypothetical protein